MHSTNPEAAPHSGSSLTGGPLADKSGLTPRGQSFIIFVFYTIIIVGTFAWSGRGADLTVYDRVVVDWGGIAVPVSDLAESERFYRTVLDLPKTVPAGGTFLQQQRSCFGLPTKKPLCLIQQPEGAGSFKGAEVVVNVKSGFPNLYELIKGRLAPDAAAILSEIKMDGDLEYFTAVDPDGNTIVFRRTKWFKLPNRR